eukprot:g45969.t1
MFCVRNVCRAQFANRRSISEDPSGSHCHTSCDVPQVQLLVTSQDVENYKQIKADLDQLRLLVEKSELWVYKGHAHDEVMEGGESSTSSSELKKKKEVLIRLSKLCVQEGSSVRKSRKQQQRLLRNMGAHTVVLDLLQIPYEKVLTGPVLLSIVVKTGYK